MFAVNGLTSSNANGEEYVSSLVLPLCFSLPVRSEEGNESLTNPHNSFDTVRQWVLQSKHTDLLAYATIDCEKPAILSLGIRYFKPKRQDEPTWANRVWW